MSLGVEPLVPNRQPHALALLAEMAAIACKTTRQHFGLAKDPSMSTKTTPAKSVACSLLSGCSLNLEGLE